MSVRHRYQIFGPSFLDAAALADYRALPARDPEHPKQGVVGLDCEMIGVAGEGGEEVSEVARLRVVDERGAKLFRPTRAVLDYRSSFSGVTAEMLEDAEHSASEAVEVLSAVADRETIIIGPSAENDFRAMRLVHERVIDTSLVYNSDTKYQ